MNGNDDHNSKALIFIGIDVSKLKLDIARLRQSQMKNKVFDNNPSGFKALEQWLREDSVQPERTHICMEATGAYSEALALWLSDRGWLVSIVNPARVKGYAQSEMVRNKTDRADAALLARFCAALQPQRWSAPSPGIRRLRSLVERLQALHDMHQQESNRLEAAKACNDEVAQRHIRDHIDYLEVYLIFL
jgi:transposase